MEKWHVMFTEKANAYRFYCNNFTSKKKKKKNWKILEVIKVKVTFREVPGQRPG